MLTKPEKKAETPTPVKPKRAAGAVLVGDTVVVKDNGVQAALDYDTLKAMIAKQEYRQNRVTTLDKDTSAVVGYVEGDLIRLDIRGIGMWVQKSAVRVVKEVK